jgi:hypothetical protein
MHAQWAEGGSNACVCMYILVHLGVQDLTVLFMFIRANDDNNDQMIQAIATRPENSFMPEHSMQI